MNSLNRLLESYQSEASELASSPTATEASFYPAIQSLLNGVLRTAGLR